jgi:hypothetical protein
LQSTFRNPSIENIVKEPKSRLGRAYANGVAVVIIDLLFDFIIDILKGSFSFYKVLFQAAKGTITQPNIYTHIYTTSLFQAVGAVYRS